MQRGPRSNSSKYFCAVEGNTDMIRLMCKTSSHIPSDVSATWNTVLVAMIESSLTAIYICKARI